MYKEQLCWTCERACGRCPWTAIDPVTKRPKFEPVPGWDAEKTRWTTNDGKKRVVSETYAIKACPLYIPG